MNCNIEVCDVCMTLGVKENVIGLYIAEGDIPSARINVQTRVKHTGVQSSVCGGTPEQI